MSRALCWHTITGARHPQFMVKGTELSAAICGEHSRYQIVEVRSYDNDRNADRCYVVRDAETVNDAELKAGKRPEIVGRFDDLDTALTFCAHH